MLRLELTLPTAEENLALDEALLEEAEESPEIEETLRLWELPEPAVIVGRGTRVADEVDMPYCGRHGIPVLRRTSGGCAIVAGPGCLMYSLVLAFPEHARLHAVRIGHQRVLDSLETALSPLAKGVCRRGTSDLALGESKFSGNSLQVKRSHLLYHGTLLYDFPLALLDNCLRMPPREPDYRRSRPHHAFVRNLPATECQLRQALREIWSAEKIRDKWPRRRVCKLVHGRYNRSEWNLRR